MYAIISNGQIAEFPVFNVRERFPGISFPANIDNFLPEGIVKVERGPIPEYNSLTHTIKEGVPELIQGVWVVKYEAVPLAEQQLEANRESIHRIALEKRATLLRASDWTQLPDSPMLGNQSWLEYRQALRDITAQPGFPLEITWPVSPDEQNSLS